MDTKTIEELRPKFQALRKSNTHLTHFQYFTAGYELANRWIEIKEGCEMPEGGNYVLIWHSVGGALLGQYIFQRWFVIFSDGEKSVEKEGILDPTHWQPLPSPPKI